MTKKKKKMGVIMTISRTDKGIRLDTKDISETEFIEAAMLLLKGSIDIVGFRSNFEWGGGMKKNEGIEVR